MGEIAERFDNVSFSPNVFTPYPGIPIWPQLRAMGLKEPQSLFGLGRRSIWEPTICPGCRTNPYARLQRGISYFLLDNQINKTRRRSRSGAVQSHAASRQKAAALADSPLFLRLAVGTVALDGQAMAGGKAFSAHRAIPEPRARQSALNSHGRCPVHSQQSPLLRSQADEEDAALSAATDPVGGGGFAGARHQRGAV